MLITKEMFLNYINGVANNIKKNKILFVLYFVAMTFIVYGAIREHFGSFKLWMMPKGGLFFWLWLYWKYDRTVALRFANYVTVAYIVFFLYAVNQHTNIQIVALFMMLFFIEHICYVFILFTFANNRGKAAKLSSWSIPLFIFLYILANIITAMIFIPR